MHNKYLYKQISIDTRANGTILFDTRRMKTTNIYKYLLISISIIAVFFLANDASAALSRPPTNLGLVGYWSMNEGYGVTTTDLSGNRNHGTLTNMQGNPWVNGKLGKALSFDGSNDYVDLPSAPVSSGSISVVAWVKSSNLSGGASAVGRGIAKSYTTEGNTGNWFFGVQPNGAISFSHWSDSLRRITDAGLITINQWYHIVMIWNGTAGSPYINGKAVSFTGTGSLGSGWGSEHVIGRAYADSAYQFNGLIDEVRIYNRALSPDEISRLYNSGR